MHRITSMGLFIRLRRKRGWRESLWPGRAAAGQPLTSTQKQLVSQLSPTLESKVISVSERGLTSTQWSVYNTDTKRIRYISIPTSMTIIKM